jgi:hypothetical protein
MIINGTADECADAAHRKFEAVAIARLRTHPNGMTCSRRGEGGRGGASARGPKAAQTGPHLCCHS